MSIELVIPSNHLIFCCPLLLQEDSSCLSPDVLPEDEVQMSKAAWARGSCAHLIDISGSTTRFITFTSQYIKKKKSGEKRHHTPSSSQTSFDVATGLKRAGSRLKCLSQQDPGIKTFIFTVGDLLWGYFLWGWCLDKAGTESSVCPPERQARADKIFLAVSFQVEKNKTFRIWVYFFVNLCLRNAGYQSPWFIAKSLFSTCFFFIYDSFLFYYYFLVVFFFFFFFY